MDYDNLYNDRIDDNEPNLYDEDYRPQRYKKYADLKLFESPMRIYEYLDAHIYSHSAYKKAISLFIWKHMHGHISGALLIAGESGSGKTEMIRILSTIYPNIHVADGASIVPTGYKGNSSLTTQISSLNFTGRKFPPVLVVDEFDKLCLKGTTSWSETGLISELLKFIEGSTYNAGTTDHPRYVDTTDLAVILLGSFSALTDQRPSHTIGFSADLRPDSSPRILLKKEKIMEQLPAELRGRISQVVILDNFTEEDYFNILTDKRYSPVAKLSREYGLNLSISKKKYREIAHEAFISHTGVRRMNNTVSAYLDEQLFANPNLKEISIK